MPSRRSRHAISTNRRPWGSDRPHGRGGSPYSFGPPVSEEILRRLGAYPAARELAGFLQGEYFSYTAQGVNIAANATVDITLEIQSDSDFVITEVTGTIGPDTTRNGSNFSDLDLRITHGENQRAWQDGAIRADMLVGTAQDPGYLPAPVRVRRNEVLVIQVTNNGGAARWFDLTFHGFRIFDQVDLVFPRFPFWHRFDLTLPAAATDSDSDQTTVFTDGFFAWTRVLGFSSVGEFEWIPEDLGEDRQFGKGRTDTGGRVGFLHNVATVRGATEAWDLPWPILFSPKSSMGVEARSLAGAQTATLYACGIYILDELQKLSEPEILEVLARSGIGG